MRILLFCSFAYNFFMTLLGNSKSMFALSVNVIPM